MSTDLLKNINFPWYGWN